MGGRHEVGGQGRFYGLGIIPYMPLFAQGMLTGKVQRGEALPQGTKSPDTPGMVTEERLYCLDRLMEWGKANGHNLLEIRDRWGLAGRPSVGSVIAGAMNAEQVAANVAASEWQPSADDIAAIDAIVPPPSSPGF